MASVFTCTHAHCEKKECKSTKYMRVHIQDKLTSQLRFASLHCFSAFFWGAIFCLASLLKLDNEGEKEV